jgi:hypothetical protein
MVYWGMVLALATAPERWYGPVTVSFELKTTGSAYDYQENDVRVEFKGPSGTQTRLAFYRDGKWYTIFQTRNSGLYTPSVMYNGRRVRNLSPVRVNQPLKAPFVRKQGDCFQLSNGKPFWPMGINVGWSSDKEKVWEILPQIDQAGMNWGRIWASSWDNKNPYWPTSRKLARREMAEEVFQTWDKVVGTAKKTNIHFQWVLFNHGSFSTRVNPNWPEHPWNAKNGGFLATPQQFFLDPEAKRQTKNYLRYVVARYGHEPSIMAWELFNEVEWVDLAYDLDGWKKIGAWHDEMASFLKSIDPYGRLVTSSSAMEHPIWNKLDYYQPHGYPPDVGLMVRSTPAPKGKPYFWGEVGFSGATDQGAVMERKTVRDGLWSGLFMGHAGAAQYWFWDRVTRDNLFGEWKIARRFIDENRLTESPAKYVGGLQAEQGGDLSLVPGVGWGPTKQTRFQLPESATNGDLGKLSTFVQGTGHRDMLPEPISFKFRAEKPGKAKLRIGTIAKNGATPIVKINGVQAFKRAWGAASADTPVGQEISLDYPVGQVEISIFNEGSDWFTLDWVKIEGLGQLASGFVSNHKNGTLVRVDNGAGRPVRVRGAIRGTRARGYSLDSGQAVSATVKNGELLAPAGATVWIVK